jgi:hypothetical protein
MIKKPNEIKQLLERKRKVIECHFPFHIQYNKVGGNLWTDIKLL